MRRALKNNRLTLLPELSAQRAQVLDLLKTVAGRQEVKDTNERLPRDRISAMVQAPPISMVRLQWGGPAWRLARPA